MAEWKQAERWDWTSPATGWTWTIVRESHNSFTATVQWPQPGHAWKEETLPVLVGADGEMRRPPARTKRRTSWPTLNRAREACEVLDAIANVDELGRARLARDVRGKAVG